MTASTFLFWACVYLAASLALGLVLGPMIRRAEESAPGREARDLERAA